MSESTREEERVFVYDHVDGEADFIIDREPLESDESYNRRTALYKKLFNRG